MNQGEPSMVTFLPLIFMSLCMGIGSFLLARDKGRNVLRWTILGAIPIVNFAFLWYFIGATNLRMEKKLDEIHSELLKARAAGHDGK